MPLQHVFTHGVDITQAVLGAKAAEAEAASEAIAVNEFNVMTPRFQIQAQQRPQGGFAAAGEPQQPDNRHHANLAFRVAARHAAVCRRDRNVHICSAVMQETGQCLFFAAKRPAGLFPGKNEGNFDSLPPGGRNTSGGAFNQL